MSSLRPVISGSSDEARINALYCLEGALEGCTSLTHGVRQAVGYFLVESCRNTVVNNDEMFVDGHGLSEEEVTAKMRALDQKVSSGKKNDASSYSEEVRDCALSCLKALLQSNLDMFPTSKSKSGSTVNEALSVLHESLELRMDLSMKGVSYRCNADERIDSERAMNAGDGYESNYYDMYDTILSTTLPRAKRSLCFSLLDGALDGFHQDVIKIKSLSANNVILPTNVKRTMIKFASMTARCIHDETDPRCLLQIFRLLNKVQRVMCPLLDIIASDDGNAMEIDNTLLLFPSTELFDAIAPYYPVQFTPPKNDPHKITQEMLHAALMAVLCEEGVALHYTQAVEDGDENMVIHAARMFMERLDPMRSSDYQSPSGVDSEEVDKLEAVGDLSKLLLVSNSTGEEEKGKKWSLNMTRVSNGLLSELSSVLSRIHEEAVSKHTTDTWKSLATSIRQFASSLAQSLETFAVSTGGKDNHNSSSWEAFVVSTINRLSPSLESSLQGMHGRASTAYLASLAAGGGMESLNKVLESCIPRFLGVLSRIDKDSRDQALAAMRGIAALMSSCRVAMERWEKENNGVKIHPHPLASYLPAILERISVAFDAGVADGEESLLSAAVAAMESMLTSADLNLLDDVHVEQLSSAFSWIAEAVLADGSSNESMITFTSEWKKSCARTLGVFLAVGLQNENQSSSRLHTLAENVFPRVIESATSHTETQSYHPEWITLAAACSNGTDQIARKIVGVILTKSVGALQSSESDCSPLKVLSFMCRNGGPRVIEAFHSLAAPNATYLDIIHELCKSPSNDANAKGQLSVGISQLRLPATITQEEETCRSVVDAQIERADSILPCLIPAFESPLAAASFGIIVDLLNQLLPPLSQWDEAKLCVIAPLLAAILSNAQDIRGLLSDISSEVLKTMIGQLSEFIISSKHEMKSRASAASCLFSIFLDADVEGLAVSEMIGDTVSKSLVESLNILCSDGKNISAYGRVHDIFNFIGEWGSISACKGGSYSSCADEIALFLVEMACTGASSFPFSKTLVELALQSEDRDKVSMLPALSFGSMISVCNGNPFWRQRIVFKTLPAVMRVVQDEAKSQKSPPLGPLTVCSILCCLPSSLLNESHGRQVAPLLIAGLVQLSKQYIDVIESESSVVDVLGINLAAIIKMLALAPDCVSALNNLSSALVLVG